MKPIVWVDKRTKLMRKTKQELLNMCERRRLTCNARMVKAELVTVLHSTAAQRADQHVIKGEML